MDEMTGKKRKAAASKLLFTALLLFICAAIYIFTENGYNKAQTAEAELEEVTTTGVFVERFCKTAFSSLQYEKTGEGVYEIQATCFDESPRVILSAPQGIVRAFTLILDAPILPKEEKAATPIEGRLAKKRKEQYQRQCAWIEATLPQFMKALDAEQRLTQSDILFLLHNVDTIIANGKQQNLIVAQYSMRLYLEEKAGKSKLSVSLQDEKNLEEMQK